MGKTPARNGIRSLLLTFIASGLLLAIDLPGSGGAVSYLGGMLLFGWGAVRLGEIWRRRFAPAAALAATTFLLIAGRWLSLWIGQESRTAFFTPLSGLAGWAPTVGDLLIDALLLLMLAAFFHRSLSYSDKKNGPAAGAALCFGLSALSLLAHGMLTRHLVLRGGQNFDFDNIFQLGPPEILSLTAVLMFLTAVFIFSHRLILLAQQWTPERNRRLLFLLSGLLPVIPLGAWAPTGFSVLVFFLIALTYLVLCDLFIETNLPGMTQLTVWLFLFSLYAAGVLYKNQLDRDQLRSLRFARALSVPDDSLATAALAYLPGEIGDLADAAPFTEIELRRAVNARLVGKPYLFRHYRYDIFSLHPQGSQPLVEGKRPEDARAALARTTPAGTDGLRRWTPAGQPYYYLLSLPVTGRDSNMLLLAFRRAPAAESISGYRQLIEAPPYRGLAGLEAYDYAVYRRGRRVESRGNRYPLVLNRNRLPGPGSSQTTFREGRVESWFQSNGGTVVGIGRTVGGPLKPATLFSFLFLLFSFIAILLAILNRYTGAIPPQGLFPVSGVPSLRGRIQLAVVGLILGSFVLTGFIAVTFFRGSNEEDQREDLMGTAELIRAELERSLPVDTADVRESLLRAARRFRHSLDLYAADGSLRSSTSLFIYDAGLREPAMPPEITATLLTQPAGMVTTVEALQGQPYLYAYALLNTRPVTYAGIPAPETGYRSRSNGGALLSSLLNVYVFLLLVAGVVAIAVANTITDPLTKLGEKLRNLRLGRNEPIEWQGQDEVAELIAAYNRMISELEENTEKLRQSEREGAWREMAQQVAHEIKNPLTPMKLSLQHLQRAHQSDPERARELLKSTGRTLIEQIDGLARIASEFSNFAKLPPPAPERLRLDELLRSAGELFRQQSTHREALQLDLPAEEQIVYADRTHLQRIFNNLLQNAWQSLPPGRSPRIGIGLRAENGRLRAWVTDNGTGIPEEMRHRVFEPKFTTKSSGMGLGLAMCRGMVEQMGGKIWFETIPGEGTTFFVELPGAE